MATLMVDDPMVFPQHGFEFPELGEQSLRPMPGNRRNKFIWFFNQEVPHFQPWARWAVRLRTIKICEAPILAVQKRKQVV